jgi:hypothetical protein
MQWDRARFRGKYPTRRYIPSDAPFAAQAVSARLEWHRSRHSMQLRSHYSFLFRTLMRHNVLT